MKPAQHNEKRPGKKAPADGFLCEVKIELLKRGWTFEDLAGKAGLHVRWLSHQVRRVVVTQKVRRKIELALGVPIWSTKREFTAANQRAALAGFDIDSASRKELVERARKWGIPWAARMNREDLLKRILQFLRTNSASRNQNQKQNED